MSRNLILLIVTFLVLALFQVLVLKYMVLFGVGFCFLYLMALLFLPLEMGFAGAMITGLVLGLTVDIFYNTTGIHAAASVFIMFIRPYWMAINKVTGFTSSSFHTCMRNQFTVYTIYKVSGKKYKQAP